MQVPGHVVSMYVATCGQNGSGLGSDEKEIILLVYVVMDAVTSQIIGVKQILVRPLGNFGKDRTISTSSDNSNSAASPTHTTTYNNNINNNNIINNNNNNNNQQQQQQPTSPMITSGDSQIINNNNNNNIINNINNNNNNNINNNNNNNNSATVSSTPTTPNSSSIIATTTTTTTTPTPTSAATQAANNLTISELPIAVAQAAGKPLSEALDEFDEYIRSLSIDPESITNFKLITDGQLPIRQCLHPEACAKDIELPSYYCKFSDLRKEYVRYKSGDLSRALVPVKDIKKLLQAPTIPLPQSIADMVKELETVTCDDTEFYIKESRDMVSIIQSMITAGHKFEANEVVNLNLEPGICSIDDEIDGSCIVRARGLPWQSSDQDIAKFFRGLNVAKGGVALCLSPLGRRNGEALIRFISQEHRDMALKRHKHHIGNRYIEVYRATGEDFLAVAGGASNEAQAFLSKGAQVIIRMRGLPYDCTAKQVLDFFTTGDNPCDVLDSNDGVLFVKKPDGRATGDAFVLFANETDAPKALSRHRESIGQRYIELFRSTTAEVQQVLNRSMDPKTYESSQPPPLIAQLPPVQMSLLPQHMITSGTTKNCIRLRGLPYEAMVEHILQFLDDFARNIIFQGVHMVINAQGQPSGEAFIQMDSEEAARQCAIRRHTQFMFFGKKYRYIEVFQCSGDDMNMVLNGGLQSPVNHHPTKPSLLSPGGTLIGPPFGAFSHFGPATTIIPSPHRAHPAAAFYSPQLMYWPYPSPPVSPTTYYGPAHPPPPPPPHVAASLPPQHQALFPVDYMTPQVTPPAGYHPHHMHHSSATPLSPSATPTHHSMQPQQHQQHQQQQHQQQQQQSPKQPTHHQSTHLTPASALITTSPAPPGGIITNQQYHSGGGNQQYHAIPVVPMTNGKSPYPQSQQQPPQPPSSAAQTAQVQQQQPQPQQQQQQKQPPAAIPAGSQHLLTIDTNTTATIAPHEKIAIAPRVLTPATVTTYAMTAAAAMGPQNLASYQGSPVTANGPAVSSNQYVELYMA